jgi:Domain of unknown function (DUF1906)
MGGSRTPDGAASRRRYFALGAVGGLILLLALGVAVGPHSSQTSSSLTAHATGGSGASHDTEAAKMAAESGGPANPAADASAAQVINPQPSWNAKPMTVQYHGYQFRVPSSWPVYNLASDPSQCVLFNTHAVYLGTPGNAQNCPAQALGRTEALLIQPTPASVPSSVIVLTGEGASLPESAALPSAAAAAQTIQVEVPEADVLVTATYGTNESRLRSVLAGATITGQAAAPGAGSGSPAAAPRASAAVAAQSAATEVASAVTTAPVPALTAMVGSGLALDTCTVPSVATMTAWLASPYRVIGTYLGGMNWSCDYGNFSASWVRRVAAEGWRMVPLWVGRQAPCTSNPTVTVIDPSRAAAEGQAEASSAVATARAFGLGPGTPVYFDMEGYIPSPSCSSAVANFLGGWTRALHAAGYLSGVYSSANSGIRDLAAQYANGRYPRPDDIWIADWNGEPVLTDAALSNTDWANHQRLHQYSGPHTEKWGGATLQIDTSAADGLVVGMPSVPDLPRPAESALPSELSMAPNATSRVRLTLGGVPKTPVDVQWRVDVPKGISATPSYGTVYLWPGATYSLTLTLAATGSLAPGRYDVPITVTSGGRPVTEAFVLVSVVRRGGSLPAAYPVVLYAADAADMAIGAQIGGDLALPAGDVTGSFSQAWRDVTSNKDLVIAVGQAAANALYLNVCGWTDPAGLPAGNTPFYYPGYPLRSPPGRDYFELASTHTAAATALLTSQLTQYALAGTMPSYGSEPTAATPPTLTCQGKANIGL